jgi:hypothetical protein
MSSQPAVIGGARLLGLAEERGRGKDSNIGVSRKDVQRANSMRTTGGAFTFKDNGMRRRSQALVARALRHAAEPRACVAAAGKARRARLLSWRTGCLWVSNAVNNTTCTITTALAHDAAPQLRIQSGGGGDAPAVVHD